LCLNVKMISSIHGRGKCNPPLIFFLYFSFVGFDIQGLVLTNAFGGLGFISFQGFLLQDVIWFDDPQHHGRTWACHLKLLVLTSLIHIPQIMYLRSLNLLFFLSSDLVPNIMLKEFEFPRPTYA
jgi:hypothetical protein